MFEYDAINNTGRWKFTVSQHYIPCVYITALQAYLCCLLIFENAASEIANEEGLNFIFVFFVQSTAAITGVDY
jgi:hypothetical protein